MKIYEADDPLVLDGTYDQEGYKPGERARIQKAHARQQQEEQNDMAKKKPAKKKAPAGPKFPKKKGKPTFSGASRRSKEAARINQRQASRPKGPRSQSLPGMAQVRDTRLDQICEDIGEGLDKINEGNDAVADGKAAAAQRLHSRKLSGYRHAGVRLSLVPGAEKVSVKREKDREVTIAEAAGGTMQFNQEPAGIEPGEERGSDASGIEDTDAGQTPF